MTKLNVLDLIDAVRVYERKISLSLNYSGLRLPQLNVISFLDKSGKITVSDLSRYMNVTRATVSVLVNELITAGIVECIKNKSDKRSYYIKLTERGTKRLLLAKSEIAMVEQKISNQLELETIQCLNKFSVTIRL